MQIKQEEIQRKLSYRFKWYAGVLVFVTLMNPFLAMFDKCDFYY